MRSSNGSSRPQRPGFTLIELLMVFSILALVTAIGVPRFDYLRESNNVRSARDKVASQLATARAAAIRRGRQAYFMVDGNRVWVATTAAGVGAPAPLGAVIDLEKEFDVTLLVSTAPSPGARDSIGYDGRGLARGTGPSRKYVVRRGASSDTVCVAGTGAILRRCSL